uniref:Uncharacterized protein n=1 Tax=Cyprinus carpio TaxID=7962 RepID=A0A8C2PZN5_CYPCA
VSWTSLLQSPSSSRKRCGLNTSGWSHLVGSWFKDHWDERGESH